MRIALVTETYLPEVNGVAMTLGRMVSGLRSRGHSVQLVRPRQGRGDEPRREAGFEEVLAPGLPIPGYPGLRFGLPSRRSLQRLWSAAPPALVHVATEGPLGASAVAAARALALPVSSSFHTNFHAYSGHYGFGWLRGAIAGHLRRFHNRSDLTLVPTHDLARQLLADGYRNLSILARGVDTRLFSPHRRSEAQRAAWGVAPGDLVVAYVGRLAPEKNLDLMSESFEAISQAIPGARLLVVGDGPSRAALAKRHRGQVFAGMRHGVDLAAHYACADLFLFPSLTETFGNVVPEALASGLAVVAFDCAAAADLIEDGANGRLVAPGRREAFVDAALELAADRHKRREMGHLAALSVAPLDWERIQDRFVQTLADLVLASARKRYALDHPAFVPD